MSELMTLDPAVAGAAPDAKRRPKLELSEDARRGTMAAIGVSVSIIAAVAFALSFVSVMKAMQPYFGAASWAVPILLDVAIAALTLISIGLELNELSGRGARLFSRVLIGYTIWANAQDAHTWAGRGAHCLPPIVFVGMVTIVEGAVRRLVGLSSETRMDKVRASRWLLAPAGTFRLWRRMRLWEITSYKLAIGRTQQQAASRALLREWHGRTWRRSAPRAERLAVRLQGASERPVAELLTESAEAIVSAARAAVRPLSDTELAAVLEPAPEVVPETVPGPAPEVPESGEEKSVKPRPRRTLGRAKKPARGTGLRRTEAQLIDAGEELNRQAIAQTGTPISLRALKAGLKVGQPTAARIRAKLIGPGLVLPEAVSEPVPDVAPEAVSAAVELGMTPLPEWAIANEVVRVNGADLDAVVARL